MTSTHGNLEQLLRKMRRATPGSPQAIAARNKLLLAVRGIVVQAARAVGSRYPTLELADLVQEGVVGVLPYIERFKPGRAPGKSLLPGYVAQIARQRITTYAQAASSPVRITSAVRRRATAAVKRAAAEGLALEDCLVDEGLSPAHFAPAEGLSPRLAADPSAELDLEAHQRLRGLQAALWQLPKLDRVVLRSLYGFDGPVMRPRAVAELVGMSVAAVELVRARALERARLLIEQGNATCPPSPPSGPDVAASASGASTAESTRTGPPRRASSTRSARVSRVSVSTSTQGRAAAEPLSRRAQASFWSESTRTTAASS